MVPKKELEYILEHIGCLFSEKDAYKVWKDIRADVPVPSRNIIDLRLSRILTGHNFEKEMAILEEEVYKVIEV